MKQLVALARAKPGELAYVSFGSGSMGHLAGELFASMAGVKLVHVPYKVQGQAITDLVSGQVQLHFLGIASGLPHIKSGKLRAIAVSGLKRSPALPDVPTVAEEAIPGFEAAGWQGWFVPAKTPRDVVAYLQRETAKVIADPDMQARLKAMGNEPVGSTTEAFDARFKSDLAKFAKVVKEANIPTQD